MKTSMKRNKVETDTDEFPPADVDTTALAEVEGGDELVPVSAGSLALGNVEGSIDAKDLIIPRLNIVQRVGPLSSEFKPGDMVLNKEVVLAHEEEPVNLIVLSIKKYYEENLPYNPKGPKPVVYQTIKEVADAGKWVDWRNNVKPPAREVASTLILIEQPDGIDGMSFSKTIAGKEYAIAMWTLRGSAYTRAAKTIFSKNALELSKCGLLGGRWELATSETEMNGNLVHVPVLRLVGKNTPELIAEIKSAVQG